MKPRRYTLEYRPVVTEDYRKNTTVALAFMPNPFTVATQEGDMLISPDTVDDWENGYFIAYPSDGSKPYAMSPKFVRNNYVKCNHD